MNIAIKKWLLIIWIIIIFVLTGYPGLETPRIKDIPVDKLYHFSVFLILAFLQSRILKDRTFFISGSSVIILAELQQLIIPGRDFELLDILAGFLGLLIGYMIVKRRKIINAFSKT